MECSLLQSLTGSVWTLQAPGKAKARVWLLVTPREEAPPLSSEQRHAGCDWTTLASWEQQVEEGVDVLPVM